MKKLSKLLVAFCISISIFGTFTQPTSAFTGETFNSDGFKYTVLSENGTMGTVELNGYINIPTVPTSLVINSTVVHNGVTYTITSIGNDSFRDVYYNKSITIPDSVTFIGDYAFFNNQATDVIISNSVKIIGKEAFAGNQLTNVTVPNSVTSIGVGAFSSNQLTEVTIPNDLTSIGVGAFAHNKLISVTIPDNVTSIGDRAFFNNQLTGVRISNSVTSIGDSAFERNQLTEVTIPDSVTSIGNYAFSSNNLTSVILLDSITSIGNGAFAANKITEIVIPRNVSFLGQGFLMGNSISTIFLASKDILPVLNNNSLFETGTDEKPIEIYAPESIAEYKENSDITKKVGENFQIEAVTNVVYKQIERFDYYNNPNGSLNNNFFIGIDENAETKPYNNEENMVMNYQWYKDGVEIIGATDVIYSETAQTPGTYQYHVTVNDMVLDEIQVTITAKNIETEENENKDNPDSKDKEGTEKEKPKPSDKEFPPNIEKDSTPKKEPSPKTTKGETIPAGNNSNVSLLVLMFIGGGSVLIILLQKKLKDNK